ncbi:carbonate dehydratase [Sutcliffiella cohnii]|uniref:carbonic anhydrase n=1 Tax=Sutcliffiella cohnii TaxID=33932 RepID=A0A223KY16_9BACI|nr:carbonic anhydrase [Sutcliffiella cohnii]AST94311.1 carbonate dehydratase [Sutcliffiella cohnii]
MSKQIMADNNQGFVNSILKEDPHYFERLKEGQSPEYFVIACSDSRVSPSIVANMPLGSMFVHRNIANQVTDDDTSLNASLYYALKHLKVKKIVIKGHTSCGGIEAACSGNNENELKSWISKIKKGLPDTCNLSQQELSKQNILQQIENLKSHPIYKKYGKDIEIVGCLFHVETGKLERIN